MNEEPKVYTVSDLNKGIRSALEGKYPLVWVQGEISNFKAHSSGHYYFSLKDSKSQINTVMFRGFNGRLKFKPESGMEVLIRGKVTVYEPRGNYQLFAEVMEPVGAGALQMAFDQLKKKLQQEGLFEEAIKKPLPAYPQHIAVVTSQTGAAIRDILNVLRRRHCGVRVTVVPALVQGGTAKQSIVKGIEQANKIKSLDVIIVGRGGGSIEDLWAFNEEIVARAIASSVKPIISAVGHEVDFTIADFVSDLRAPTPSAAAELVVKNKTDLLDKVSRMIGQLLQANENLRTKYLEKLRYLAKRLIDPKRRLQEDAQRCDELETRLENAIDRLIETKSRKVELLQEKLGSPQDMINEIRQQINLYRVKINSTIKTLLQIKDQNIKTFMSLLESLSPLKVVERGYSIVTQNKSVVKSVDKLKKGDILDIQFAQGKAKTKIEEIFKKK